MLPFTKRPGRAEDSDVITKDDLPSSGASKKQSGSLRPPAESIGEDEMTNIIPSRSINTLIEQQLVPSHSLTGPHPMALSVTGPVIPAAGRPPTLRPPPSSARPGSMRPPPSSRGPHRLDEDEDEDDGRTVVRGAPKIVKRTNPKQVPASMSPAAVIKATLDSARSGPHSRRDLLPGPPAELLEDRSDFELKNNRTERFGARSAPPPSFEGPPSQPPSGYAPPSSHRYNQNPNATGPNMASPSGYPAAQPQNVPGVAVPPSSMPAHFMTPQAPYSNPDPPGTSVTSGHRVSGRPAVSWAAALLACGLFVGVAAVAVMQSSDAVADTTASFVDPARAPLKNAGAAPVAPTPVPMTNNGLPVAPQPPSNVVAPPPVQAPPPTALAPTAPASGMSVGGFSVVGGFAPVAVASTAAAPKASPPKAAWRAPAPAAPKAAPAKAPALTASNDDEPKKDPKKKKGGEPDDETKKALEALQKAQLESASSFGKE
jgi:hypothetical protein